jgi:glutamate synthase (NADPH/NADH) small chain
VEFLKKLGVKIHYSVVIGRTIEVDELLASGFGAVYIAVGAGLPMFMKIPGENLNGVFSANEFLTRVNLMRAYDFPDVDTPVFNGKNVAVIGGGNVAMDCARTSLRLGAKRVSIIYRRSRSEMPARHEEIVRAEEEGIIFFFLTNPIRYIADERFYVRAMECVRMELGQPDAGGRRSVKPIPDSEQVIDFDTIIVAIGAGANPIIAQTTPDLKTNRWGYYVADEATGLTSKPKVYAGGDIVTGSATVISAMGAGRAAARAIHEQLVGKPKNEKPVEPEQTSK